MPIYEYQCGKCGHVFEHFTFSEEKDRTMPCPECRTEGAERIISPFSSFFGCGSDGCGSGGSRRGFS